MQDYHKSNKIPSLLWIKSSLNCFKFRIKLKPREGVVKFPKFCDSEPTNINESGTSDYVFEWHEKVFSRWEFNHYSEPNNCILENEKEYNRKIQNEDYKVSQMFTYLDSERMPKVEIKKSEETSLIERVRERISNDVTSSTRHLFKSELDLNSNDEQWQSMHIVWDNSEYNEDSQILFKDECLLLSLNYNPSNNTLLMSPRENDIDYNPYDVYTGAGVLGFQYGVQVIEEQNDEEELVALVNKLNSKLDKKQKSVLQFVAPPLGRNITSVHFEIVTGENFDHDNVYVEYTIKVPNEIDCSGDLHGRTHVSKMLEDGSSRCYFGHVMNFELEYNNGFDPPPLTIYFEVISVDWWRRHRTEGYAYIKVALVPGNNEETRLECRRPEEDKREAERRRFFVGECHLIKDLRVLDHPQDYDAKFRFVTSGDITVRWNVITQAHNPGSQPSGPSSASRLLQGAEDALQQYSRAKATLASATEDLDAIYGSGDR
ncbi:Meckel syndrome type 1 protein [Aricia agestis]|uniref:Meckel syndrome type 1 protein n=1 Tax=Aricia agestis TaxID=91739 RepID=UPI001C209A2B|nr:Meckel syndrome type 1 protein [Aricia agestis]